MTTDQKSMTQTNVLGGLKGQTGRVALYGVQINQPKGGLHVLGRRAGGHRRGPFRYGDIGRSEFHFTLKAIHHGRMNRGVHPKQERDDAEKNGFHGSEA
jgi:hypothetical protein